MSTGNKDRALKKLMIRALGLGFDAVAYRSFLAAKTGKRQLGRMTDAELDTVLEALNTLGKDTRAQRQAQKAELIAKNKQERIK